MGRLGLTGESQTQTKSSGGRLGLSFDDSENEKNSYYKRIRTVENYNRAIEEANKYEEERIAAEDRVKTLEKIKNYPKELLAAGADVLLRTSPIEPVRAGFSGAKEAISGDRSTGSAMQRFERGQAEFSARPLLFEKATGESITNDDGTINWKNSRSFVARASEIPTFAYTGAKAGYMAGKGLLSRIFSRTLSSAPEVGINTAIQTAEEGSTENIGTNLLVNSILISGISNVAGEVSQKSISSSLKNIEKEIGTMDDEAKSVAVDALYAGVKEDDIVKNAKRIKENDVTPGEVEKSIDSFILDTSPEDRISRDISSSKNKDEISELIKDKIPDEPTRIKVAKQLEVIEDPDEVKRIIDSYDPVKIREDLSLKIATTDNEKRIATFLKDVVPEEDIPTLSRTMKGMEDETQIAKLLDEFQINEKPVLEAPIVDAPKVETPKKFVEREMTEQELATALAKKEVNRFKPNNPRFAANRKGVGMAYSSLKKRLAGDATAREIKNTRKYLESNYLGKQVKVEGKAATVRRNAYGKVGVDFGDGKVKFYAPELVKAKKVTDENVIQKIIDDAKKELSGKQAIYKLDTKIKEEVIEPEVKNPEPVKEVPKEQPKETPKADSADDPILQESRKSPAQLGKYKVTNVPIDSLPERATAVAMTDENFQIMADFIKKNGSSPIIIDKKTGRVLDGQHRAFVSQRLGIKEIPAVYVDQSRHTFESVQRLNKKLTDRYHQATGGGKKETPKAEPKKEAPKSDKPNKSGLVKTLEKTAENRGVKLKKEEIPRLASKMKMDDETKKAFKVYAEDPQKAIEMAIKGEAPDGVRIGSLYTAVRDTAIVQNDVDTLYRLRSSREAKGAIEAAAEAGRDVKAYDSSIMSDPVKIMREVDDLKKQIAEKSGVDIKKDVKSAEEEIGTFIERNASTDADLSKLVQKITC